MLERFLGCNQFLNSRPENLRAFLKYGPLSSADGILLAFRYIDARMSIDSRKSQSTLAAYLNLNDFRRSSASQ